MTRPRLLALVLTIGFSVACFTFLQAGAHGSDEGGVGGLLLLIAAGLTWGFRRAVAQRPLWVGGAALLGVVGGWWLGRTFWFDGHPLAHATGFALGVMVGTVAARVAHNRLGRRLIFLSYRRSDTGYIVGRLREQLVAQFGRKRVFMDIDSIAAGDDFRAAVVNELRRCHVVLSIIGDDWTGRVAGSNERRIDAAGDFVRIENEEALRAKVLLIPVLVEGARMPDASQLPESLAELPFRNGVPLRPDPDFNMDVGRLVHQINHAASEEEPRASATGAGGAPKPRSLARMAWNAALGAIVLVPMVWLLAHEVLLDRFQVRQAQVSPDGRTIAAVGGDRGKKLRFFDLQTGRERTEMARTLDTISWFVRWSPDGDKLVIGQHDGKVRVHSVADGSLLGELDVSLGVVHEAHLAWSADSKRLAVVDDAGFVRLWSSTERAVVAKTLVADVGLSAVAAWPGDRRAGPTKAGDKPWVARWMCGAKDGGLHALDETATEQAAVATAPKGIDRITISPDGRTAVVELLEACLLFDTGRWDSAMPLGKRSGLDTHGPAVQWAADGSWAAIACGDFIHLVGLHPVVVRDRWKMKWDTWNFGGIVATPRGSIQAVGGDRLFTWDTARGELASSAPLPKSRHKNWDIDGTDLHGNLVLHSRNAATFLIVGSDGRTVREFGLR